MWLSHLDPPLVPVAGGRRNFVPPSPNWTLYFVEVVRVLGPLSPGSPPATGLSPEVVWHLVDRLILGWGPEGALLGASPRPRVASPPSFCWRLRSLVPFPLIHSPIPLCPHVTFISRVCLFLFWYVLGDTITCNLRRAATKWTARLAKVVWQPYAVRQDQQEMMSHIIDIRRSRRKIYGDNK